MSTRPDYPFVLIADKIIEMPEVIEKASAIIETATTARDLRGKDLWETLTYSGITLGVEEFQRYVFGTINAQAETLRTLLTDLEAALPLVSDFDALVKLNAIQANIRAKLRERADGLTSMHVTDAERSWGIPADFMKESNVAPPFMDLVRVGYIAAHKQNTYFDGWVHAVREEKLDFMKCKCMGCMIRMHRQSSTKGGDETMARALEHFGSLDRAMHAFGSFVVEKARDSMLKQLEGSGSEHDTQPGDMPEIVNTLLAHLRGARG